MTQDTVAEVAAKLTKAQREAFLRTVQPFVTDDWPDRKAVYAHPHLWDQTVEREWRYQPAPVPA